MYLTSFDIKRIKCFHDVQIKFPHSNQDASGWNVILGGNGTGKSTLLQAIAVSLVGPLAGQRLANNCVGWARKGQNYGEFKAALLKGQFDSAIGQPRNRPYSAAFAVIGDKEVELEKQTYDQPQLVQLEKGSDGKGLSTGPYAANRPGWLACGYGPFRRLTGMGGNEEYDLVYGPGRAKRFATLFREGAAITNCTEWLVSLYTRSIDPHQSESERERFKGDLESLRRVINDLLPGGVEILTIDSRSVQFHTIGGMEVTVPELSDGYRSFLALAIDLLRHVHESVDHFSTVVQQDVDGNRVTMEGVVLIDEVDAHLHPRWQRQIGFRLCRAFPKIQFIVTSHSPFVAQAARDHGLFVLRQSESYPFVDVSQPVNSVRGWRVDQVLTDRFLFDLESTRDEQTEELMQKHSQLIAKREWVQLTDDEKIQLIAVEQQLSELLTAPGETAAERTQQEAMKHFVDRTTAKLGASP